MQSAVVDLPSLEAQARAMWSMIEAETGDPRHRTVLAELYKRTAIPDRDPAALARAVQQFVQDHIKYLREHPETYATPSRTLAWRVGDCDDQAMVVCTLLRSARIPCRLVLCGANDRGGAIDAQHVYAEAELSPGRWTALETVRRVPPGWNALDQWRKKGRAVAAWRYGDRSQMASVGPA